MVQIQIPLTEAEIRELKKYEALRNVPVDEIFREYLAYLLDGGVPVMRGSRDFPSPEEFARITEEGGSFDWLLNEPDLYTLEDGEPI